MSDEEDTVVLLNEISNREDEAIESQSNVPSNDVHSSATTNRDSSQHYVVVASCVAAIGGVLFGYDIGIISGAILQLKETYSLDCFQQELVVSMMVIGAILASFSGGLIIDYYGRRWSICFSSFLFLIGACTLALSNSYQLILVGRFIVGFAVALSSISECIYISEISQPSNRGMLVSLNELGITLGFLLSYLVNYLLISTKDGWRLMFGVSGIPAVVQGVAMLFLPQTPHFLFVKRKDQEAEKVIKKLWGSEDVRQELTNIRLSLASEKDHNCYTLCGSVDNMCGRMVIGMGIVFFQQFTGQPNIMFYASKIFALVGFCGKSASTLATVGLGIIKVVATCLSLSVIDRVGRRPALIFGATCMMTSIALLGVFSTLEERSKAFIQSEPCSEYLSSVDSSQATHKFHYASSSVLTPDLPEGKPPFVVTPPPFSDGNGTFLRTTKYPLLPTPLPFRMASPRNISRDNQKVQSLSPSEDSSCPSDDRHVGLRSLAMLTLMCYVAAYAFGFGPVTWLVLTEIFPTAVRGRAMAAATSFNWVANLIVSATFLQFVDAFTIGGTCLFYSVMCLNSILFVFLLVPETRNKTLQQISQELKTVSAKSRMRQNLQGLPCFKDSRLTLRTSRSYSHVSCHNTDMLVESTVI